MPTRAARRTAVAGTLAALLAAVGGCAADVAQTATPVSAAPSPTIVTGTDSRGGPGDDGSGRHRRGEGTPASSVLPADFPSDVPLPTGTLQAASGTTGRWSVLLVVSGSAADALRSAMGFYVMNGFSADSASSAHRGRYAVTLVTENRDHDPTSTNLVVGLTAA